MGTATLAEQLAFVSDDQVPLPVRAVATCYAAGVSKGDATGFRRGGLSHVMDRFRALAVPDDLVEATSLAAARTREPITILVPLIWSVAHRTAQVIESPVPATLVVNGLPLYALDKHTRLGRRAITHFGQECDFGSQPAAGRHSGRHVADGPRRLGRHRWAKGGVIGTLQGTKIPSYPSSCPSWMPRR
jgi:hypothetical protein